jgi:hypothetical protein
MDLLMESVSPDEAAAVIAAIEQFLRDTTAAAPAEEKESGWVRTARLEAVDREPDLRF